MRRNTPSPGSRARTSVRRLVVLVGFFLLAFGASAAFANWAATGTGSGSGAVGTLAAPTTVTASSTFQTVHVSWTVATPPSGTLAGYAVTRTNGATTVDACGTSLATQTYLPAGATTCDDTSVPDDTYTYQVTAVWRSWTSTSTPSNLVTVSGDPNAPSQAVSLSNTTNAALVGATVFFRNTAAGSFRIVDAVSDGLSGPASATFPAVTTSGWTHAAETVTTGTGTNPKTFTSSPFTWTTGAGTPSPIAVVGRDVGGNTVTTTLGVALDNAGPTGGALTVNSVAASAGGTTSDARVAFNIARTDFNADAGSGVASSVLTRETATYTGNACGTFGSPTTLTGAPTQTGLATGCYRYTLTGTDNVGNTSVLTTVVRYDVTAPTLAVTSTSTGGGYTNGTNLYYRSNFAGSFTLITAVTDQQSGPASVTYPALTNRGWTHPAQTVTTGTGSPPTVSYASSTYSWTARPARPTTTLLTAADIVGNTGTRTLTFVRDNTNPTGGALTVNGTTASTGGTTSFNRTGSYAIARTDFTDASSGIASSVLTVQTAMLTNNTCGAYGATTVIAGAPAQSGITTGCYRYVLTGTDNVGNTTSRTTVVKVDREAPINGVLTVNGAAATAGGSTTFANANFPIDVRTDYTDIASGLASSVLTRANATLTGNTCGTFGATTTLTGNPAQTGLTTGCYRYVLTGTDNAGNTSTLTTTVKFDNTAPTGGALTVNGTAASAGGSASTSNASSFAIARNDYTDANSGLASSTLTVEVATLTGTTCGTYGAATVITGSPTQSNLAPGCYRYRLAGTDNAGNTSSLTTVVQQRVVITGVTLNNVTGTAGRVDAGDRIDITFSDTMAVNSICSTWAGNGANQTLGGNNNVAVTLTNGGAANDTITFGAATCTLNVGSINLGSTAYATANVTFSGTGAGASTVSWNVATRTLSITLGTASGAGAATVTSSAPVVTPSGALLNTANVGVGGTFTLANVRQF